MKQGEIWMADLSPNLGTEKCGVETEIGKTRPFLVISPNLMREPILVAPISSTHPGRKNFRHAINHNDVQGLLLLDQIRAVDPERFKMEVGTLPPIKLNNVLRYIQKVFEPGSKKAVSSASKKAAKTTSTKTSS
jgi:mRNA-degrading endonuclease toxin of MazEF toxin-antitoxin module